MKKSSDKFVFLTFNSYFQVVFFILIIFFPECVNFVHFQIPGGQKM